MIVAMDTYTWIAVGVVAVLVLIYFMRCKSCK